MTRDEFEALLRKETALVLTERYFYAKEIHMFPSAEEYNEFRDKVAKEFPAAEMVIVVGSGNWAYSLNPEKSLKQFDDKSDVDVAIISEHHYEETWDEIRRFHRSSWYAIDFTQRQRLRRNGENIYAGFVSPSWIPGARSDIRFAFRRALNRLSDERVDYRKVNALYFRNEIEAVDYYLRGFTNAKASLT